MELKNAGNAAVKVRDWTLAYEKYTAALAVATEERAVLLSNRSMVALKRNDAAQAVEDARAATVADPKYVKAHFRLAQAALAQGDRTTAEAAAQAAYKLESADRSALGFQRTSRGERPQLTRSKLFTKRPHSGGHWPGKKNE